MAKVETLRLKLDSDWIRLVAYTMVLREIADLTVEPWEHNEAVEMAKRALEACGDGMPGEGA